MQPSQSDGLRSVRALHGWHAGLCVAQNRRLGILGFVVGERSLFSQMVIVTLATVPLWKVIAGPAPANYNRTRKGPVFLFLSRAGDQNLIMSLRVSVTRSATMAAPGAYCWSRPAISPCHGATHRSITPTKKLSETASSMMITMGTKVVAVSKLLAEVWMMAPSPEIEVKNS